MSSFVYDTSLEQVLSGHLRLYARAALINDLHTVGTDEETRCERRWLYCTEKIRFPGSILFELGIFFTLEAFLVNRDKFFCQVV